jgi:hypothetical protein
MMLRATGAGIGLPLLDAMLPTLGRRARAEAASPSPSASSPKRLLAIHVPLGMMPQFFFPETPTAADATEASSPSSPYLDLLADHRSHFTSFSGISHPDVDGNHHAAQCFLTGAPGPGRPSFRNSLSLDQFVAEKIGLDTRFPFLALSVRKSDHYSDTLAVSRAGVDIPAESSPRALYRRLFVAGTPEEQVASLRRIRAGGSVLDLVLDKKGRLERAVSPADRNRLDQYFTSVRDLEQRLQRSIEWEHRPKPQVDYAEPQDIADAARVIEKSRLMFDLVRLAFETDSTRVVTLSLSTFSIVAAVPGVKNETHELTHHGGDTGKIAELKKLEEAQLQTFGELLAAFRGSGEQGQSLLDQTALLYGSCLGNANSHSNRNLPIILAGGGFRHGGHLAFNADRNEPLANLFVSMLQRLGIEADSFASSTGTLRGLET